MKISKLKHLLLAPFCLAISVLCPAIQCMQVPERNDDFEAVVKRGYYGFLDRIGKEKFKELGLEDPIEKKIQGHEAIYQRFLNGVLVYRPQKGSDAGMVTLPIRDLANPLEGTFDLSHCGNIGQRLSISTGYRKGKKQENANKVELWIVPRFLVEKEINGSASHFKKIFPNYWPEKASIGIIWTLNGYTDRDDNCYAYLSTLDPDELSKNDLSSMANQAREIMSQDGLSDCAKARRIAIEVASKSQNMYLNFDSIGREKFKELAEEQKIKAHEEEAEWQRIQAEQTVKKSSFSGIW